MPQQAPYESILLRDGTSQQQRQDTVLLNKTFALADEHSLQDLFDYAQSYSESIKFFDTNGAISDWQAFFKQVKTEDLLLLQTKNDFDPQVVLYLTFLRLFAFAQQDLNQFTQRHLDFYYKKVLALDLRPGVADNVHLIFELAKTASVHLLQKGTAFDAGKDAAKTPLRYSLTDDVVINKTAVASLRSVHRPPTQPDVLEFATVSNSGDGVGRKLLPDAPFWDPFGLRHVPQSERKKTKIGFALASALFLLKEGERTIGLTLSLAGIAEDLRTATKRLSIPLRFDVFFTGEKAWLNPASDADIKFGVYDAATRTQQLLLTITLADAEPAVVPYNQTIHGGAYETEHPVIQLLADTTQPGNLFGQLKNATVARVSATVSVSGITSLQLENDHGTLNPKKPFQPFGAVAKKGSSFYVSYDELQRKKITDFGFKVTWLDPPANFKDYYKEYGNVVGSNAHFKASYYLKDGTSGTTELFLDDARGTVNLPHTSFALRWNILQSRALLSPYRSHLELFSNPNFRNTAFEQKIIRRIAVSSAAVSTPPPSGFIRFELQQGFLQDLFPSVYTAAVLKKADAPNNDSIKLPKEPYVPVIKSIEFSYKAEEANINPAGTSFGGYTQKKLQLFHLGVFGQAEQNGYLKEESGKAFGKAGVPFDKSVFLLPQYNAEGELYIGLQNAEPGQSVSFLFQLAEGSANPDKNPPQIQWAALCNNEWRGLLANEILKEETAGLQQPGIIRLVLPNEISADNSLLDKGMFWLRLTVPGDGDAVSLFYQLLPQAAKAVFVITDKAKPVNDLTAGTISKMLPKDAAVKTVSQPFASFGGRPVESDDKFYLRISERLRHKDRAVMNWDYEHLVLQAFPELYKAKCLNHSSDAADCCNDVQPGHVSLVVVPDIRNKNAFNPLEPKVSTAIRMKVQDFLKQRMSFFADVHVQNPDYEKVLLNFNVKFSTAGDFGLYRDRLNEDIKRHLTPWAYDSAIDIHFGGQIRKSALLNFVEELPYVSFLTNFNLFHVDENGNRSGKQEEIIVKNPRAILVSSEQHEINPYNPNEACL